ncbi:MAG: MmcQ/YjbR family DNA-binding protein [Oscillospiraceae bacterium]|nr:MmcQ/YjbR family DNA-binding protein [Oscillospiraceae bacterium]
MINVIFKNKKVNMEKLKAFGFAEQNGKYIYRTIFPESGFEMTVTVTEAGEIAAEIIDPTFNEPYTLHLTADASGSFVGKIRSRYEEILTEISEQCFEPDVFKSKQAKALIEYVRKAYGDELEFLWKKFDNNAVWRRKDTKKWYCVFCALPKRKLGIDSNEVAEIIVLRILPDKLEMLLKNTGYYPGYHMNKKNWYTIILDGSVNIGEIFGRIDESYKLAVK